MKRIPTNCLRLLVTSATLALALACGSAEKDAAGTETAGKPSSPAAPTPSPKPTTPAAAANATYTCLAGDAKAGATSYATYCATCHGRQGAGDGPAAGGLSPKPARHDDGGYMNGLSNEHLFKVVDKGGTAVGKSPLMTPWGGVLNDEQIWDVVAFMRTLAQPEFRCP